MPTSVIFDIETDCSFSSLRGMSRDQGMRVMQATVVCALVVDSDFALQAHSFEEAEETAQEVFFWRDVAKNEKGPFDDLFSLFDDAEVIVAFNGLGFDFPVLRKHYGVGKKAKERYLLHRLKTLDPMLSIAAATDLPFVSLDKLLKCNRLDCKTSNGLEAINMWNNDRREELLKYCMDDVRQLAHIVYLSNLHLQGVGQLPNSVHGIASAILAQRAINIGSRNDKSVIGESTPAEE